MSLQKSEILRLFLVAIFVGLFCGREETYFPVLFLFGTSLFFLSLLWKNKFLGLGAAVFLAFSFASYRTSTEFSQDKLILLHHKTQTLKGSVVSFPDQREKNIRVVIKTKDPYGKALLVLSGSPKIHYGDEIQITGKLSPPVNFKDFDYTSYLKNFGVQTIIRNPKSFEVLSQKSAGNFLLRYAESLREYLAENLRYSLPSPHERIAMGILLGVKNEIPSSTGEDFKRSGLQHLLVVSGFNVSVILLFLSFLFRPLGRRALFLISLPALVFFVAMTGAESPVLRASIMGGLTAWGISTGRISDAKNIFLLSLVLIGCWNPRIIQNDIGFFLSASATFGILYGVPFLEKKLSFLPEKYGIRTLLAVTLSAQITVLPILGFFFHEFPVIGLFSNLFAEPLVPLGMFFSFAGAILGFLPQLLLQIISIPAFIVLEGLILIAHVFAFIPPIPISQTISQILLLFLIFIFLWKNIPKLSPRK